VWKSPTLYGINTLTSATIKEVAHSQPSRELWLVFSSPNGDLRSLQIPSRIIVARW
jgi:hypothetical protein